MVLSMQFVFLHNQVLYFASWLKGMNFFFLCFPTFQASRVILYVRGAAMECAFLRSF